MVKNRTSSMRNFDDLVRKPHEEPETPMIPNLRILEKPSQLKLPKMKVKNKEIHLEKEEEEILKSQKELQNRRIFHNYILRTEEDLRITKESFFNLNRRRIFSENSDSFFGNKNSIFSFMKNSRKN